MEKTPGNSTWNFNHKLWRSTTSQDISISKMIKETTNSRRTHGWNHLILRLWRVNPLRPRRWSAWYWWITRSIFTRRKEEQANYDSTQKSLLLACKCKIHPHLMSVRMKSLHTIMTEQYVSSLILQILRAHYKTGKAMLLSEIQIPWMCM